MARPELAAEPRQEYVDDGYSGTSTSRPAFQRLIQDAQDGKLKTIIVKDFSRFARDYIEAGDYMERIFPLLGVRFISVNDGYDSGMQAGNDVRGLEVAIKNIINASYSRDLSAKIAAADHVMQKKGMYLGGYRPFGFLPDPNDCHTVREAGDVMHLSQNVVETFIDRIEVFNNERVKIRFTFEDVLADHAE